MQEHGQLSEKDPRRHTAHVRGRLEELIGHLRDDIGKIDDPRAQALFETTAEGLGGLVKAYEHFDAGAEEAWRS